MINKEQRVNASKALILGVTFKEDCPDIRNSKVIDIYNELLQYGMKVEVYDPHADHHEVSEEYNINLVGFILLLVTIVRLNLFMFSSLWSFCCGSRPQEKDMESEFL
jgi:UDP-glucose 6-dehydrogenase